MLIKFTKKSDVRPSEITSKSVFLNRREFMKHAAVAGAGVGAFSLSNGLWLPGTAQAASPRKFDNLIPSKFSTSEPMNKYAEVTGYNNFYELGTGKSDPVENAAQLKTRPWTVTFDGEVDKPGTYDIDELLKGKLEERIYRMRCVEAWSMVVPWVGISFADLIKGRVEPNSNAKYVEFTTILDRKMLPLQNTGILPWPYLEGLRLDEAMNPLTLMAVGIFGEELPNQNGAPIRLVVPWKYGFKSIKSIVRIRFTKEAPLNTWQALQGREYGFYANVNPEVDHPRWSQAKERRIGEFFKRDTLKFNGYEEEVASLYAGMDLAKNF